MKYYVANPIYDTVFKYLMEDERIARTILSALLKKNVVAVEQRPHEYTNVTKNDISMFRIDFAATVRDDDGNDKLILIELQKTWLETETLRFRQYLGAQYNRKENIVGEDACRHALPMVAVYLLGHRVGDIDEPVIYVDHKSYDYNGNEVTKGMPDPFVESLIHNSIVVQIPLLHGRVNPNLDKALYWFDQTNCMPRDKQMLEIDDDFFSGNVEMEYIMHRLMSAASNPEVRQDMNVEDEYFKAIEDRDTAIMNREREIALRDKKLEQQQRDIEQRDRDIEQQQRDIEHKDHALEQQNRVLEQKSRDLEERDAQIRSMIKGMAEKGIGVEEISQMTGKTVEEISLLLD